MAVSGRNSGICGDYTLEGKEVSLLSYVNFRVVSEVDELGGEG